MIEHIGLIDRSGVAARQQQKGGAKAVAPVNSPQELAKRQVALLGKMLLYSIDHLTEEEHHTYDLLVEELANQPLCILERQGDVLSKKIECNIPFPAICLEFPNRIG